MRRDRKEYLRKYQNRWISKRRSDWILENGPCKHCGSEEKLEVDHIDPKTKKHNPRQLWSRNSEIRTEELKKCQVLCKPCHLEKTKEDVSLMFLGKPNHKLRIKADAKFLAVKELVESGLSERYACDKVGLSRGTYSSTKARGYRSEVFQTSVKVAPRPVKTCSPRASRGSGAIK